MHDACSFFHLMTYFGGMKTDENTKNGTDEVLCINGKGQTNTFRRFICEDVNWQKKTGYRPMVVSKLEILESTTDDNQNAAAIIIDKIDDGAEAILKTDDEVSATPPKPVDEGTKTGEEIPEIEFAIDGMIAAEPNGSDESPSDKTTERQRPVSSRVRGDE